MSEPDEPSRREFDAERLLDAIAEWLNARDAHRANEKRLIDAGVWEVGYASADTGRSELEMRRVAVAHLLGFIDQA